MVAVPSVDAGTGTLIAFAAKDPSETADYGIDATALFSLTGDHFTQAEVVVTPLGLSPILVRWDDTHISFRLVGGTAFTTYNVSIQGWLASGEAPLWNGTLMCGTQSIVPPPSASALFTINGFPLTYAGTALTIGSN